MIKQALNFEMLIDQHLTPTFVLDRNGEIAAWNKACEALTGLKSAEVLGTRNHWRGFFAEARPCLADLVLADQIETISELYDAMADVNARPDAISVEHWYVMPGDGRRLYVGVEAAAIRDEDGQIISVIETVRDLTSIKSMESKLRSLASLDGLTGIANRRTFDDALATEWRRALRSGVPLSLLMIDIDHFKQFNDTFGHRRGDECLREVAGVLAAEARRAGDFPARYGGEEFGIILPATESAGAAHIAENIRRGVENLQLQHPLSGVGPFVTVSIGMASISPAVSDRVEKLVCFADIALYRAKETGRNRTCSFDDAPGCAVARCQPTAGIEIPVIDSDFCEVCRQDAPTR